MANQGAIRLMKELRQLEQGDQLAMTVTYRESNIRRVKALIVGPPGTPYALGFYQFALSIPREYPAEPPKVDIKTTNHGQTRFGPNLYAGGKVCLSILGTWHGDRGEQWSPAQGLESVLLSIQSLLSANPYLNEPGYENSDGEGNKRDIEVYNAKICHENLRLAVIEPLEEILGLNSTDRSGHNRGRQPEAQEAQDDGELTEAERTRMFNDNEPVLDPMDDYCKKRFLWYLDLYKQAVGDGIAKESARHGTCFPLMSFESMGNQMEGTWNYPDLQRRLNVLEGKIMEETHAWPIEGHRHMQVCAPVSMTLQTQYDQVLALLRRRKGAMVDLTLVDNNLFLWRLTYMGSPATLFDGGVLTFSIYISPHFPDEQPRVFVDSPLFHVRVSTTKVLVYLPARADDMRHHIEGIINSLEDVNPPYNPLMTVNSEATKLCWGSKDEQKLYSRMLRRSIEATVE